MFGDFPLRCQHWRKLEFLIDATAVLVRPPFGPDNVAAQAATRIEDFRNADGDWLVLVLHGVDGEGWGSLALAELVSLVDRCQELGFGIRPLAELLARDLPAQ